MSDKLVIYPDPEAVEEIYKFIDIFLENKPARNIDAIGALVALMITKCLNIGVDKGTLLAYISNAWEINDPENDHPLKSEMPSFKC